MSVLRFCVFHFSLSLGFTGAPFWLKAAVCQSSIRFDRCVLSLACYARVRCVRLGLSCCVRFVFLLGCVCLGLVVGSVVCVRLFLFCVCFGFGFVFVCSCVCFCRAYVSTIFLLCSATHLLD